jgi:hypothetical protein
MQHRCQYEYRHLNSVTIQQPQNDVLDMPLEMLRHRSRDHQPHLSSRTIVQFPNDRKYIISEKWYLLYFNDFFNNLSRLKTT